jgi:undecaprenyl phosphate-alpha-L-ara4FN deformylase
MSLTERRQDGGASVGLRVDVDTFRGTRDGVPKLIDLFVRYDVRATFFMSVGPDNMGRHLWRLLKPAFLKKMLRSKAASLYGWDIVLRGTAWPGPIIGDRLRNFVRLPYVAGHEIGLHAWDHYSWQSKIEKFTSAQLHEQLKLGFDKLSDIIGAAPHCSAAAGWRCNEQVLLAKEAFNFQFNSDCRGFSIFQPLVEEKLLAPQIPVTLPTYDEVIGMHTITPANYNDFLLGLIEPQRLNVYTIHAEVEGIALCDQFEDLLRRARDSDIHFLPLGELLSSPVSLPHCALIEKEIEGREGWLATQGFELS